jgi:hypothetical protein
VIIRLKLSNYIYSFSHKAKTLNIITTSVYIDNSVKSNSQISRTLIKQMPAIRTIKRREQRKRCKAQRRDGPISQIKVPPPTPLLSSVEKIIFSERKTIKNGNTLENLEKILEMNSPKQSCLKCCRKFTALDNHEENCHHCDMMQEFDMLTDVSSNYFHFGTASV